MLTKPTYLVAPITVASLVQDANYFLNQFKIAEDNTAVIQQFLTIIQQFNLTGGNIYDANIVATMLAHGIGHILTHDVAGFNRFASLITVIPLQPSTP